MVRAAFGISRIPFAKDTPTHELCMHPQFATMNKRLQTLFECRGIGLFTGEVGCGKSTALRLACQALSPQTHKVVYLCRGLDNPGAFYTLMAHQLDIIPRYRKTDVAAQVSAAIAELADQHKIATVLVIDEAHLLKPELLDEVRLVHNAQFDSTDKLATALVGQPALRKTVELHRFLPLRQRITVSAHLGPLSNEQAHAYIQHQLQLVDPTVQIFHPQALNTIVAASKGVPRLINAIAIKAMTHAAENKHASVEQQTVLHVLDEMGMN